MNRDITDEDNDDDDDDDDDKTTDDTKPSQKTTVSQINLILSSYLSLMLPKENVK